MTTVNFYVVKIKCLNKNNKKLIMLLSKTVINNFYSVIEWISNYQLINRKINTNEFTNLFDRV